MSCVDVVYKLSVVFVSITIVTLLGAYFILPKRSNANHHHNHLHDDDHHDHHHVSVGLKNNLRYSSDTKELVSDMSFKLYLKELTLNELSVR